MQLLKFVILYSACSFLILNVSIPQVNSYNSNNKTTSNASHMPSKNKSDLNIDLDLTMINQQYTSTAQNRVEVVSDEPHDGEIDDKKIVELFNRKLKSLNTAEVIPRGTKRSTVLHRMNYLKHQRCRENLRSKDIFCGQGRESHDLDKCIRKSKRSLEQNVVAKNIEELQSDVFASKHGSLFDKRASYSKNFNPKNRPLNKQRYKPHSYMKNKLNQYKQANKFTKANSKKIPKGKHSNKLAKQHSLSGKNQYASKKGINVSRNKVNPNKLTNSPTKDGKKKIYPYSKVRKNDKFVNQKSMKNYKKAPKISRKISNSETEKVIASGKLKKYNNQHNKVESRKSKLIPASKVKNQNIKKKITEAPRKPASKLINKNMKNNFTAMSRKPESKVNNKNIKKNFTDTSHKPDLNITIKLSGVESKMTQTINEKSEKNPIKSKRFSGRKQKEISYGISNNKKFTSTSGKNIRDMEKKINNLHKPEVKISIMSPDSKSKALITVKDNDQHNYTRSKRMKGIDRRLNSNEFQKIKVKRKVGLHRNFPARNHPSHKRSVNIRKQSILKSLDKSTRDNKAKLLYEIKDFIVKNFRNREQRHTSEKLHGHKKRNDEKDNSYSRKKENANANSSEFSNISGNENGNFGLLEEIKDFVVQNFHPEKSKRTTSDNETHDEMSKTVKRETNRPPSFASENVTLTEYDTDLDNNPKREAYSPTTISTSYFNENILEEKYVPTQSSLTNDPSDYSSTHAYEVDHEYNDMTDDSIAIGTNHKDGYGTSDLISSKIKRETDPSESSEIYADDSVTNFKNADEKADDEAVSEREDTSTTDNNESLMTESYSENVFTSKSSQLFAHPTLNENFESEDQNSEQAFSNLRRSFSSSTSTDVENLPSPLPSLFYNHSSDRKSVYLSTENPPASSGEFISDELSSTQSVLSNDDYVIYQDSSSVYPEQFSTSFVQQKVKASREDQNVLNGEEYDYEQLPEATHSSESFPGTAKDTFYTPQNKGLKTSRLKKLQHPSELLKFNKENVDYNEDLQSDGSSVENVRLNSRDTTVHSVETYSSNGKNYQQRGDDYYFEDTPDSEVTSSTQTTKRAKHILTKSLRQHKNMNNFKQSQFIDETENHELSNPITHALGRNVFEEQLHDKETEYDYEVSTQPYETDSTTDINKRDYSSTELQMINNELPYLVNTKQMDNNNQNTMTSADYDDNSSRPSNPLLGKRQGDVQKQQDTAEYDYDVNADANDSGSTTSKEVLNSIANAVTQIHQKDLLQRAENSLESSVAEDEDEQKPDSRVRALNKNHVKSIKENAASSDYDYGSNGDSSEERASSSSMNTETHASESELFGEGTESTKGFSTEKLDRNENKDVVIRNHQTKNIKQQEVEYDYASTVEPTDGENIEEAETVNSELDTDVQVSDKEKKNTNSESTFSENVQKNDRRHPAKYFTVKRNNKTLEQEEKEDYKNENAVEPKNVENSKNEMSSSTVNTADEIFHKDVFGDDLAVDLQNSEDENEEETQILSDSSMHSPTAHQNRNEKEAKERNPKPEVEYSYENPSDSNDSEDIITEISNSIKNNKWVPSRTGLTEDGKEETSEYSQNDSEDKNEDSTDFASFQDASGKRFDQTSDEIRSYTSDLQSLHFSKEAPRTTDITQSTTALTNDPSENFLPNDLTQNSLDNSNVEYDDAYENMPDSTIEIATVAMKSGRESRNLKESTPSSTAKEEKLTPRETTSVSPIQSSTNQMTSVTEINSPDTEMTTEIYDINSIEDVGIRDVSNNASNLNESFTAALNATQMSEVNVNTTKRELESNTTLATHAATLQNIQIMPEITTVNREARNFNAIPEEEESSTLLEEDYQNSNDTNEDYYAETINSNNDKLSEYSSTNAIAVSPKNKRTANENEEVEHKDDIGYTATENDDYDVTSTTSENEDEENVSTNPVEENDFEVESVVAKNSGKFPTRHKTKREDDEKLKQYFDSIAHFKHRNLRNSYESMTHIKTRKTRDIQSLKPTTLLPVEHPKTSAWLFGIVGVLAVSSITLGLYHIIPKRSKIENMLSDYEAFTDDSRRVELCTSDIDASDKWLEEVKHINSFISEVLQKCENCRDGSMKEKYSTNVHLSKIHAAMTGTIN